MKKQFILCVKVAWTVAALIILLMYAGACGSDNQACSLIDGTTLVLMGILTFPSGVLCVVTAAIVCGLISGEVPYAAFTTWFLMLVGGCLQWYIVVPYLLEEPRLTLLNLNSTLTEPSTRVESSEVKFTSPIEASPSTTVPAIEAPRKPLPRKRHNQVLAFDKCGRTPLERVINQHARDASA